MVRTESVSERSSQRSTGVPVCEGPCRPLQGFSFMLSEMGSQWRVLSKEVI